ncbi:MAG: RNA polymerase subunit sigma-70 [Planctomycetes bacterium]|nr:RNA polymerase subunit sigma-70 [Planctomycetota bacterium]
MSSTHSVTHWIAQLKAGDHFAAQKLWESYFDKLVRLARQKLRDEPRRVADEEDVALSAFDSFCQGAQQGKIPQLEDRNSLWGLLVVITARKALDLRNHNHRAKRGGGKVRGESVFLGLPLPPEVEAGLDQVIGPEPTPAFAAQVAEECRRLLDRLEDAELKSIALWKMEGYTNAEIAGRLECVTVTVERRLRLIRRIWEKVNGA